MSSNRDAGVFQAAAHEMAQNNHYPELDGVRGIAILLVMGTHFVAFEAWTLVDRVAVKVAGFGWMGVDLFFVLSGFLITGILLDTRETNRYWSTFYARRALRIFPLYFAVIVGLLAVSYLIIPHVPDAIGWRDAQAWYWTYSVNWLIALNSDWERAHLFTGHLWSLAIEEQFYLFWPIVVWRVNRRSLIILCLFTCVGVLGLRLVLHLSGVSPISIFVGSPTRLDALLMGALAALLVRTSQQQWALPRLAAVLVVLGALMTLAAIAIERETHPYGLVMQTVGFSGISLLCTGIVLAARTTRPNCALRRLLRNRVLIFFGVYSYALYMLHQWSELIVLRLFPPVEKLPTLLGLMLPWVLLRAGFASLFAIGFALVSWHLLEKHFLAFKPSYHPARVCALSGAAPEAH